ncbi:RagB/SusD family nutrient uptake outer membrane protein [Phocaeicola sp.]
MKKNIFALMAAALAVTFTSCNDDLDMSPDSKITPENYLWQEAQLGTYALKCYDYLPVQGESGPFASDNKTDIQAHKSVPGEYVNDQYKVGQKDGAWSFGEIYNVNYFLNTVLPRYKAGELSGNEDMIKHYIGEMYFFRALSYWNKLSSLGDFPILKTNLPDDKAALIEQSKRMPRTEVARFIISDLDSAIVMMQPQAPDGNRNRLSAPVAQLLKSRVALFEGTWLKYFKDTPFVPNGPGWPGAEKEYNKGYTFQAGSIDEEINYFLDRALESADAVASTVGLTPNSGILPQGVSESNSYVEMFGAIDMAPFEEVLLWKAYDKGLGVTNNIPVNASTSNLGIGITRGMVNSFLMENGLPYYAAGSEYEGDESIGQVRAHRDQRATLFLKEPGQLNMWINTNQGSHGVVIEPKLPNITTGTDQFRYNTGYTSRKGVNPDKALCDNWGGYNGCIVYRASEAYLNYIEAYYERNGRVEGKAIDYWKALRKRAGVSEDIQATIDATDMAVESQFNWGAYSGGKLVDKTLYNIRRERVCEFFGEGYRKNDLRRWRAMDQLMTTPFHIEGFKVWGNYYKEQYAEAGKDDETYKLVYGVDNEKANVSSPELSSYLRPYQIAKTLAYEGYTWHLAHYLEPIAIQHFKITATDQEGYSDSPIYQNPYWPVRPDMPALQ